VVDAHLIRICVIIKMRNPDKTKKEFKKSLFKLLEKKLS
jgi:endonuclease III